MKKLLIVLTLFSFLTDGNTQSSGKFLWGMAFTPKYSIIQFEEPDLGETEDQLGLNLQPTVGYKINDRISLLSGVIYNLDRFKTTDYSFTLGCDFTGTGFDYYNSWVNDEISIHYLGIPLQIKYDLSAQSNSFYLRLGYNHLFKMRESVESVLLECGIIELDFSSIRISNINNQANEVNLGFGFEIDSGLNSSLLIEAVIGYPLMTVMDEIGNNNNINLIDLGLTVGVLFDGRSSGM